jgi:transitional endoplasmic reticulum ATPase
MDGIGGSGEVLIIASTVSPSFLDEALVRPGRLDHHIEIGLPTENDKRNILEGEIDRLNLKVNIEEIQQSLHPGMSCAHVLEIIDGLCKV